MSRLTDAIDNETKWTETWNGADALKTTGSACVDFLGRAGAMREASVEEKQMLFDKAWKENPEYALKLLFYTRDFRDQHGYGEKDMFRTCFAHLAKMHPDVVVENLPSVMEFGCAKDLYCLIGTPAEEGMWQFMKQQWDEDRKNMAEGKNISLLAKWIASPDASSQKTAALGRYTAKKLGYGYKNMREYKKILRGMRKYLDVPEIKMSAGKWDEIDYSHCTSRSVLLHRQAFEKHDPEGWQKYIDAAAEGTEKINTEALTPVDVIHKYAADLLNGNGYIVHDTDQYDKTLETLWANLPDVVKPEDNVLVMADTSGSMFCGRSSVEPIEVSAAMALYFSERLHGDLKGTIMTFDSKPTFVKLDGYTLEEKIRQFEDAPWGMSTNLEGAYRKLLDTAVENHVPQEDMPNVIMVVSDMQINACEGQMTGSRMAFYDQMKKEYEAAGYKPPKTIFWNVNAVSPAFHASAREDGISFVSGYSANVFRQAMDSIDRTPYDMMLAIVNDPRYERITVKGLNEKDKVQAEAVADKDKVVREAEDGKQNGSDDELIQQIRDDFEKIHEDRDALARILARVEARSEQMNSSRSDKSGMGDRTDEDDVR